ncbi:MAG: hypothetical protein AAF628_26040 [Planctomycetota bacterium]
MKSLVTFGCVVAVCAAPCHAGGDDELTEVVATTLTSIRENPSSYKGVRVTFSAQFSNIGQVQNPFFTRFVASDFANFHVWADDQPIWREREYDNVYGLCFVAKTGDLLDEVFRMRTYQRLRIEGVVRNTFQGRPWLEVTRFAPLPGRVDTATLTHLYRGEQHMERRQWSQAIAELSLAPSGEAPRHVQAAVHKNIGLCYLRLGEQSAALRHLHSSKELSRTQDHETDALIMTAQATPGSAIDRAVSQRVVPDFERPLWEAFNESGQVTAPTNGRIELGAPPSPQGHYSQPQ